jgi:hypothetical protein
LRRRLAGRLYYHALWLIPLVIVVYLLSQRAPEARPNQHLLEFGWNTPRLQDAPAYIEAAQNLPFDGLILDIATPRHEAGLSWTLFGAERVDRPFLDGLASEMSGLEWGRLSHNLLRVNVTPGNVDWYDDFDSILYNMEAIAKQARDLGFAGIMFDTEQYPSGFALFDYSRQIYRDRYSYDEYAEQVYRRGQEVMAALNHGYPGLTVLYTYSLSLASQHFSRNWLPTFHYGLLVPFVEGMIAAADSEAVLVDGFEVSYGYTEEGQFRYAADLIRNQTATTFARDPDRYRTVTRVGFGLWLDHDCANGLVTGGCPNGFTPESFRRALNLAQQYSDGYVWVYSQRVNWYTGDGIPMDWQPVLIPPVQ